jgi:hypothetical protein
VCHPFLSLVERFFRPSKVRGLSYGGYFVCPESLQSWLPNKSFTPLCAVPKPYYCKGKIQTSVPSCYDGPAWPCIGAFRPCIAAATGKHQRLSA